jgi:hypothetical protein
MPSGVFNSSTRNCRGPIQAVGAAPAVAATAVANTNPHIVPRNPIPRMTLIALPDFN